MHIDFTEQLRELMIYYYIDNRFIVPEFSILTGQFRNKASCLVTFLLEHESLAPVLISY